MIIAEIAGKKDSAYQNPKKVLQIVFLSLPSSEGQVNCIICKYPPSQTVTSSCNIPTSSNFHLALSRGEKSTRSCIVYNSLNPKGNSVHQLLEIKVR